jgi:hypothetical protein
MMNDTSLLKHSTCSRYISYTDVDSFSLHGRETEESECGDLSFPKIGWYAFLGQMMIAVTTTLLGFSMGGAWDALYML